MKRYIIESDVIPQKQVTEWLKSRLDALYKYDIVSYTETHMDATNIRVTLIMEDPVAKMEMGMNMIDDLL